MVKKLKVLKTPLFITHYTDLSGLLGLLKTGKFWASNVSFLNDRQELLHGISLARRALKSSKFSNTPAKWSQAFEAAAERLEAGEIPDTYAVCFCEQRDMLSLWRGYGGDTQGVSITFRRLQLEELMEPHGAHLFKVIYGNTNGMPKVTSELKSYLVVLDASRRSRPSSDSVAVAYEILCELIPQFKHFGFRDEREWRFVFRDELPMDGVEFRQKAGVLVPFIKIGPEAASMLPISKITVGPGPESMLTAKSIERFLQIKGLKIAVEQSTVPFRV
ncbi:MULTISPECIES: DUF2971 domain-containing protein [unclassified Mesorhizobium]|uniref:DUF2971 domain-containing protein n=1 Tax=unclassified Mesorhizobium TaxID=325217 RepID=UPI00333C46DA